MYVLYQLKMLATLTCDQALFFGGARKYSNARVGGLEKGEKRTPDTITARVVCRPLFVKLPSIMSRISQETSVNRNRKSIHAWCFICLFVPLKASFF